MEEQTYSQEFLDLLHSITAKRAKTVIDHILKYGSITTEDLKNTYGYNHPPRAIRDVKDYGIPIVMHRVTGSDGRKIAAYKFGEFTPDLMRRISGRHALSKKLKEELIAIHGAKCSIYNEPMSADELQIDHRVPFEVGGDYVAEDEPEYYQLLSPSANRLKSWACEKCDNWNNRKDSSICLTCYWAYPENYEHIAMTPIRRLDIMFSGDEIKLYEEIKKQAASENKEIQDIVKGLIERHLQK
jgi:hypothetical protein